MAVSKPLYLGPRLRRLRRELGLTQQAMADDLEISASYVALLERNQRPVTADMLLRLARTYELDVAELASEDGEKYVERIRDVLRDPLFADIDLPTLEISDLATSFPGISEALLRLHGAFLREQDALVRRQASGDQAQDTDPVVRARRYLADNGNYFDALDRRAETLAAEIADAGDIAAWINRQGTRVRFLPPHVMAGSVRRFDRHNQQLLILDTLDRQARAYQMALHAAYTAMRPDLSREMRRAQLGDATAETLTRRALAGYAAVAILMPYDRFAQAARERGCDVEALANLFDVTFEQAAHRLTTLQRPGQEGVPFFLIRMDEAGNVSKRLDGSGAAFAMHGGGCPLWSIHSVFRRPGEVTTQWLELPDGQRFISIARTVSSAGGTAGGAPVYRSIALVCDDTHADSLAYGERGPQAATPIGITCTVCNRADCRARAVPPIGREILPDDYRRTRAPYGFSET